MKLTWLALLPCLLLAGCDDGVNSGLPINESQIVWHGKYNEIYRIEDKDANVVCWITESRTQSDSAGISCLPKSVLPTKA